MLPVLKKKKIIEAYVHILPVLLKKKYGKKKQYTKEQIEELASDFKFDKKYIHYAFALFMSKQSFSNLPNNKAETYDELRQEVANKYFKGIQKFTIHDLMHFAVNSKSKVAKDFWDPNNYGVAALGDPLQNYNIDE